MNTSFGTRAYAALLAMVHAYYINYRPKADSRLHEIAMRNAMRTATK